MKRFLEPIIVITLILTIAVANFWHVIVHTFNAPPGTVYVGVTHYYEDYFYYLSHVTQGARGAWTIANGYTTESIPPTPLWWTNIAIGKISAILDLYPWTAYNTAVFFTSLLLLVALYLASRMLFPKQRGLRVATFIITITSTCYYLIQKKPDGSWFINPYQYFYNYTESFNRLGGVVHLMMQSVLSLLVILIGSKLLGAIHNNASFRSLLRLWLVFILTLVLLMFINPVYVAIDSISFAGACVIYVFIKPTKRKILILLGIALASAILLLVPTVLMLSVFKHPFYQYFRWWETTILPTNAYIFFHSLGSIGILGAIGLLSYCRRGGTIRVIGFIWAVLPIILYLTGIPKLLSIPYFRLHQPPSYIILAALAVEGLLTPGSIISYITKKKKQTMPLFWILFTLFVAWQIPMMIHEVQARVNNYALTSWLNHPKKEIVDALLFLRKQPHDRRALAFNNLELLVPVVSGHTVYEGHHSLTYNYAEKIKTTARFFTLDMTSDEAESFLKTNTIGYILLRQTDGDASSFREHYTFLNTLYENTEMTILQYR